MLRRFLDCLRSGPTPAETLAAQAARLLARLAALRTLPEAKGAGALRLMHRADGHTRAILLGATLPIASRAQARFLHHPEARRLLDEVQTLSHPLALLAHDAAQAWFLPKSGLADLRPGDAAVDPSPSATPLPDGTWTLVAGPATAHMRLARYVSFAETFPDLRGIAFGGPDGTPLALAAVRHGRAVLLARPPGSSQTIADGVLIGPLAFS